jgi:hypothetical protein
MMRHIDLSAALAVCVIACGCAAQPRAAAQWKFMLLSWKSTSGHWYFSLRPNGKEEVSAKSDAQHRFDSVAALKSRLAELPPGTHVNWSKYRAIGFDYPPETVIVDIQHFARQHGLYMYSNFVMEESSDLTNRWSQPLAVVLRRSNVMKRFSLFATRALASGGSAPSR